jgi:hypothetical protein
MNLPVLVLTASFVLMLLMNVPVAFAIGWATVLTLFAVGSVPPDLITAQRICSGIDSFALLAIPFFVVSGVLMGRGGMARRLIEFADSLVGHFTGGLGHVSTLTNMMFGTISGSAAAAVSSVGSFMIPEMERKGYDRDYSIAIIATASTTGLLIPPSNVMIVYALVSNGVSVAAMFMAGLLPGMAVGGALMLTNAIISRARGYRAGEKAPLAKVWRGFRGAFLSLLLIVIVIGGILAGVFTATEAAAIAVVYSFILAVLVYREVKWSDLPGILLQSGPDHGHRHGADRLQRGHVVGPGLRERAPAGQQRADRSLREQIRALAHHQRPAAGGGHVYGHDARGADLHPHPAAGGGQAGPAPGAFRHDDDRQPVHRPVHAAGGHLPVPRLQRGQVHHRPGLAGHDPVLHRHGDLAAGDHLLAGPLPRPAPRAGPDQVGGRPRYGRARASRFPPCTRIC